jgi:two-component system OmpR family response regulator
MRFLRATLPAQGYRLVEAVTGQQGLIEAATRAPDLVLLDLGLPDLDGVEVTRRLREWRSTGIATPVLILTARDGWSDRVDGLDAGADDYLTKPFHLPELAARVRAALRRSSGRSNPLFQLGGVVFDTRHGRATVDGVPVDLTSQEVAVLSYLIHNTGRLISRTELSEHIYEYDGDRDSNTIAVFINRLRKKLGPDLIQTVRGRGYMIDLA